MESLVSQSSSSSFDTRVARKKSPFMPFKDKIISDTNYAPNTSYSHTSPLSATSRYFDRYPRPSSSPSLSKGREAKRGASPPKSNRDSDAESMSPDGEEEIGLKSSTGRSFQFPSFDSTDDNTTDFASGEMTPKPHIRTRSRSGPSKKSGWKTLPHVPPLRFSGTSTVETPPQTPVDSIYKPSLERTYPVVVGVEAMDALVDGMNGLDSESYFGGGGGRSKTYRSRFAKIPNHHPLYQPPLPTPPPGVTLGGGSFRHNEPVSSSGDDDEDDEDSPTKEASFRHYQCRGGRSSSSPPTSKTIQPVKPSPPSNSNVHPSPNAPTENILPRRSSFQSEDKKSPAPSISDIIRTHAPPSAQVRSRPTIARSQNHGYQATVKEETESEPEPEPLTADEEAELMTRSSIDSIANEVQQTLRNQRTSKLVADLPSPARASPIHELSLSEGPTSPRSEKRPVSSIYSSAVSTHGPPSIFEPSTFSASQSIAQYLRSTRLTTLLKLTRYPHATPQQPLTVSLSDLGSPQGFPVVMFLGLGCVRHVMGLYDEMAEILGLRLITIDRWGLGRTDTPRPQSARGIMEWASVVEEVLDMLKIEHCSVMAHSAGAPYALSFANRAPDRIRGDICLLAPWVGGSESGGYKWLKYVPNGILKTAQAAEWKVQAWMIGKPPTIAWQGIGNNTITHTSPRSGKGTPTRRSAPSRANNGDRSTVYPESQPRPSIDSNVSSEYDDLRDFDGRFESRSTLGAKPPSLYSYMGNGSETKKMPSRGFLRRLKSTGSKSNSQPHSPTQTPASPISGSSRKLKALRSMGSLRNKSSSATNTVTQRAMTSSPQLPEPLTLEVGLGLGDIDWTKTLATDAPSTPLALHSRPISSDTVSSSNTSDTLEWAQTVATDTSTPPSIPSKPTPSEMASVSDKSSNGYSPTTSRAGGRRSMSFSASRSSPSTVPTSPVASTYTSPYASSITPSAGGSYQAALGNALIAASHAESAKGTHNDFLQILNHDNRPWGFQYSCYPHKVRVWYGDKDEKIAENAVRWMERNMGEERCQVKVVKGADHALMYKSAVVIEVLERIREHARAGACTSWIAPSV